MKYCSNQGCKEINPQPEENFSLDKEGSYSWRRSKCKMCRKLERKEWAIKNREKSNDYMRKYNSQHKDEKKYKERYQNRSLKKRYGLTLVEYRQMLENQNHQCAMCDRTTAELKKKLIIDHCHLSTKVRALLCYSCNRSLALIENKELYSRAKAYLEKYL